MPNVMSAVYSMVFESTAFDTVLRYEAALQSRKHKLCYDIQYDTPQSEITQEMFSF